MGAFDNLFGKKQPKASTQLAGYFQLLDGYVPIFTTYDGGVYEMEITRACIHAFANHCSKLLPTVSGADKRNLQTILNTRPNFLMTSAQFLYKTATIYEAQNTCFIAPVFNKLDEVVGFYPMDPMQVEIVQVKDNPEPWIRYTFRDGSKGAAELARCGVVTKYLYRHDIHGETNDVLRATMALIDLQNKGIEEGIKNGASIRFMATTSNFVKGGDLAAEKKRFVSEQLGPDSGGLLLFPQEYQNAQQINGNPQIVDPEQMKIIENRVYNYFGTNEKILQNAAVGDDWAAYYEGKIEPFAIQLSQAMTCMTFNANEYSRGNRIDWSANRLQYMTNKDKLEASSQMFDRGVFTLNQIMDIWNLPHLEEGGDERYIRREYINLTELSEKPAEEPEPEPSEEPEQEPEPEEDINE